VVKNGDNGDIACDGDHRYKEDAALMRQLNLNAYRYSIAWPRMQPNGTGSVNQKGLDHYKRVTDAILEANVRPLVTLYHWDIPQALVDKGGWANRDMVAWVPGPPCDCRHETPPARGCLPTLRRA